MSLQIGQLVGGYEVIGAIGVGGMGSVYKVRNVFSDRLDAMKVLLPDLAGSADLADRFLNEIKVLASLQHPNIASLYTALKVENQLLMVMEFVDGTNLDEKMRGPRMPIGESVSYLWQVLAALSFAHSRGVIHRDIKPANVAINRESKVKLLDFGIARGGGHQHLTRTGMVLGSLYYMSPEQVTGETADARSDLYSVGVTLYRALTGKRPVDGENEYAVMRAQVNDMPVPPIELNPSLPLELSNVIMRSLAKKREERFQTAEQFMLALDPFLPSASTVQRRTTPEPTMTMPDVSANLTSATPLPSSTLFTAATLAVLQKNLAMVLGPIAGPVVRKSSRTAGSLPELCEALSTQIPGEVERKAFLRACAREIGAEPLGQAVRGLLWSLPRRLVQVLSPWRGIQPCWID